MDKIALFDFDDTLIHGDSGRLLLGYYLKKHPLTFIYLFKVVFFFIGYQLHLCPINKAKSSWLYPLDKMSDQDIENFYVQCIEPRYYDNVVKQLKGLKDEGYKIVICSASVEAYLRFCRLPVDIIIGTRVEMDGPRYTSHMIDKNCKREEKVLRIEEEMKKHNLTIDYDCSYAYSDSLHDIPMLKMVKNRVRVNKKDGHTTPFLFKE